MCRNKLPVGCFKGHRFESLNTLFFAKNKKKKKPEPCSRFGQCEVSWHLPHFQFYTMHHKLLKNEMSSHRAQLFPLQWASILLAALQRWSLDKSSCCLRHDALDYGRTRRRCDSWLLYYWREVRFQFLTRMKFSWDKWILLFNVRNSSLVSQQNYFTDSHMSRHRGILNNDAEMLGKQILWISQVPGWTK